MEELCIIHMSDTHILKNYYKSKFFSDINQHITPVGYVSMALEKAKEFKPDLLVITGDLVHEGRSRDYQFLKFLVNKYLGGIPVFYSLGNHDIKREFYKGIFNTYEDTPYIKSQLFKGYRFISLDTSEEMNTNGVIHKSQLNWLEKELKKTSKKGTILLAHHPLQSEQTWFKRTFEKDLLNVIKNTDVFLYLCGHAHFGEYRTIENLIQITGESFAFGVESHGSGINYTEARAFNCLRIINKQVICHTVQLYPHNSIIYSFNSIKDSLG